MAYRELLNTLIADRDFQKLHRLLNQESIFSIMRIAEWETVHTRLLAWLLNPLAGHGMGSLPLRTFVFRAYKALQEDRPSLGPDYANCRFIDPVALSSFDLERLSVEAEYAFRQTGGPRGRTDVFVYGTGAGDDSEEGAVIPYVVIEYKVNAKETTDQTSRYADLVKDCEHPVAGDEEPLHPLMVYVCKDGQSGRPCPPFVVLSYSGFKQWLDDLRSVPNQTEQGRVLVSEFAALLQTHGAGSRGSNSLVEALRTKYLEPWRKIAKRPPTTSDRALERVWGEHRTTLELIGFQQSEKAASEAILQWEQVLMDLRADIWEVNGGDRAKMIDYLPFRQAMAALTGKDRCRNPRLQLYIDHTGKMKLELWFNSSAALEQEIIREKTRSLRTFLAKSSELHERIQVVEDAGVRSNIVARIQTDCGTISGAQLDIERTEFTKTIKFLEESISKWLTSNGVFAKA